MLDEDAERWVGEWIGGLLAVVVGGGVKNATSDPVIIGNLSFFLMELIGSFELVN